MPSELDGSRRLAGAGTHLLQDAIVLPTCLPTPVYFLCCFVKGRVWAASPSLCTPKGESPAYSSAKSPDFQFCSPTSTLPPSAGPWPGGGRGDGTLPSSPWGCGQS